MWWQSSFQVIFYGASCPKALLFCCAKSWRGEKLNKTWSDFTKWPVIRSSNCKTLPSSKCFLPSCSISRRESLRVLYSSFCWHLFWKLPFMFRSASCVLWSSLMLLVHHHFHSKAPKPKVIVRKAWNCAHCPGMKDFSCLFLFLR